MGTPVDFGAIEQTNLVGYQDGRFNRRLERSVDSTDVSKRAVVSLLNEMPFGRGAGVVNRLIGGWQVNTIGIEPSAARWFNTDAYVNPPNYTFGNVGRVLSDVRGPGTFNWDLSFIKNTRITERFNLQFRAEMFDFMNNVNLGIPNGAFSAGPNGRSPGGTFGTITSARDSRNIQLGLKLLF